MAQELRCEARMHGVLLDGDVIEFKCTSRFCGARRGLVILHRFDLRTGEITETLRFKNPEKGPTK